MREESGKKWRERKKRTNSLLALDVEVVEGDMYDQKVIERFTFQPKRKKKIKKNSTSNAFSSPLS